MNMKNLYLILHKVRGEPAFDIAQRYCLGSCANPNCGLRRGDKCLAHEEDWWIIPTSGHSAYPIDYWLIEDLADVSDHPHDTPADQINYDEIDEKVFAEVQDHYQLIHEQKPIREGTKMITQALLQRIGLMKEAKPFQRRRL